MSTVQDRPTLSVDSISRALNRRSRMFVIAKTGTADEVVSLTKSNSESNEKRNKTEKSNCCDFNIKSMGYTPLHMATQYNDASVVEAIVDAGADIEAYSSDQGTPLWSAASCGQYDSVSVLVKHRADINAKGPYGCTPLMAAIENHDEEMVLLLCNHKADVNESNDAGVKPLEKALEVKNEIILDILCRKSAYA